ncbi:MAG: TrgA family protein [Pseudomonadota bacterium]
MGIERGLGMPTTARLVAAISVSFSLLAMVYVVIAFFPEERLQRFETRFLWTFGIFGAIHGWWGLGKKAARPEEGFGIFLGMRSTITVTLWIVFMCAVAKVIDDILDAKLAGARPMRAIIDMFQAGAEYLGLLATRPDFIGIIFGVGIFCGMLTRHAAKNWD